VRFTLPGQYSLNEDAVIGVQSTITGTACLNISSLGSGTPAKPEFLLVGRPSPLNSAITALGEVSGDVKPLVADVRETVGDVRAKVVPNLGETLVEFKGAGSNLKDMLGDTKGDFRETVANLKDATGTIKTKLPETMDSAKRLVDRLDETVKNAEGTLTDVKTAMHNFVDVSRTAREVVGGNKGKLDAMIASLKATGRNLEAASSEIRHSPWRLLYKPGKGEVANLNLYDSARQFADGAEQLNGAALALRDALQSEDADPEQVKELLQKLDVSFTNFREVEEKLWTTVQE
jgi:ABC-type transporter Mla subunit MlaD